LSAARKRPAKISTQGLEEFFKGVADKQEKPAVSQGFDWISQLLKLRRNGLKELNPLGNPLGYTADIYKLSNIAGSIDLDGAVLQSRN